MTLSIPQLNWGGLMPFLLLTATALGVMVLDLFLSGKRRLSLASLGCAGLLVTMLRLLRDFGGPEQAVGGMLLVDDLSRFLHLTFLLIALLTLLVSVNYLEREEIPQGGEYYALILFGTLGMMVMASATDLIMIFLGLETLSIPLFILSGFLRSRPGSNESALKYLLLGALASAFLLYGIALLYGATGSTRLARIAAHVSRGEAWENPLVFLGVGLLLTGLAFKVAAVPFHMWLPDVYEGAPTPVTAFMIAGTKGAALAALLRAFGVALAPIRPGWVAPLWVLAALTMGVGNVAALTQRSIKRMLAYSSIAHAGYLLVALVAGTSRGFSGILFYLVAYAFMNLGAFAVVIALARQGEDRPDLSAYAGLGFRHPLLAFSMAVFMFSLAGLPPTGGFMGKFYIFTAAVEADFIGLTIIAVLCSLVSVFFYLRVVVVMYMEQPGEDSPTPVLRPEVATVLILSALATLQLGILPGGVWELAVRSVRSFWG